MYGLKLAAAGQAVPFKNLSCSATCKAIYGSLTYGPPQRVPQGRHSL
jgi:hypothetical protein